MKNLTELRNFLNSLCDEDTIWVYILFFLLIEIIVLLTHNWKNEFKHLNPDVPYSIADI